MESKKGINTNLRKRIAHLLRVGATVMACLTWIALGAGALATKAWANRMDESNPTFNLDFTFGLSSTYKSKYADMNDTGSDTMYSLGGNAGQERNLGFMVRTDTQDTTFKINDSKIKTVWQDSVLRYSIGVFYLGVNFSQINLVASKAGTKTIDAAGSGTGGNLGINYDFDKNSGLFYLDVTTATVATMRNSETLVVKGGSRTDIDLGLGYHITKESFVFLLGYKQRTFTLSADTSYAEAMMTTYIGLRTALYF